MRPTRLANQTETDASPRPVTFSRPLSSTVGDRIVGAGELGPVGHVLDSAVRVSRLNHDLLALARLESDGSRINARPIELRRRSRTGPACPAAIQSAITRYSSESVVKRIPPPCSMVPVGLSSIRLSSGAVLTTRRPSAWRVKTA